MQVNKKINKLYVDFHVECTLQTASQPNRDSQSVIQVWTRPPFVCGCYISTFRPPYVKLKCRDVQFSYQFAFARLRTRTTGQNPTTITTQKRIIPSLNAAKIDVSQLQGTIFFISCFFFRFSRSLLLIFNCTMRKFGKSFSSNADS